MANGKRITESPATMDSPILKRDDLLYPQLSYQIIGCAYDVFNELGPGHPEKVYQRAMAVALRNRNIAFKEQQHHGVQFSGEKVGTGYCDFLVEEKIVVEIKKGNNFSISHMEQVFKYLKSSNLLLALVVTFGAEGVRFKRIPNIKPQAPSNKPTR
jgi:GxxExxY protein